MLESSQLFAYLSTRLIIFCIIIPKQDAQLGIESVGHIGKDSNGNRSR